MSLAGWNEDQKIKLTVPAQSSELIDSPVLVNLSGASGVGGFDCSAVFDDINNGNDEYTKLLIHSDSVDGSTVFTDSSSSAHTITAHGDVHHEVDQKKFGNTSMYFDGASDYLSVPDSEDWNLGADHFTLDFLVYMSDVTTTYALCGQWTNENRGWVLYHASGNLQFSITTNGSTSINYVTASGLAINCLAHIAVVRSGPDLHILLDGVLLETHNIGSSVIYNSTQFLEIGIANNGEYGDYLGYIDEFRISKGIARWTENFTTPTAPYNSNKKIAVELADTGVQTQVEVENWESDKAILHVKVPTISATVPTILNLYYDSEQLDNTTYIGDTGDTPAQAVWDSNFVAVYHMSQDPSTGGACILDSTANARHATPSGSMTNTDLIDGYTGKALIFDGIDDYLQTGTSDLSALETGFTLEIFADWALTSNWFGLLSCGVADTGQPVIGRYLDTSFINNGVWGDNIQSSRTITAGFKQYGLLFESGVTNAFSEGAIDSTGNAVTIQSLSNNVITINSTGYTGQYSQSTIQEVRVSDVARSVDWIALTNNSLRDNLITFSAAGGGGTISVLAALGQPYDLARDPVIAALAQDYHLTVAVKNALSQIWAHVLEQALNQHYGDADQILAELSQYYNDAPHVLRALVQKYDDMAAVAAALGQQYNMMFKAETALTQEWAICGDQAIAALVQEYDMLQHAEVMAALGQYWGLFRDRQDVQAPLFYIMADGVFLNPAEFGWTISASSAAIECTVPLFDQAVWKSIQLRGHMEIHWNGITYEFFIEEKPRTRAISGKEFTASYILKGLSLTAGLEAPYARPVTKDWPITTMASVIVAELAEGVEIAWQIDDFPVLGGTFNVVNQTPLTAIKSLIGTPTVEAVVQTSHDGKLIIRREFPVSPNKWHEVVADHTVIDDGGVFSDSDNRDVMPGYNYVEISDQEAADSSKRLESENISDTTKRVRGYSVPWDDDFPLDTSGGSWVAIVDNGVLVERVTETWKEFVDGACSVSKPIYDRDLQGNVSALSVTWLEDDLGEVTASEDGSLSSAIPGNSLATISYLTKYREWTVTDDEIESVQVFIPGEEVAA